MTSVPQSPLSALIAYTLGEPAGIGADIIIQLAQQQALATIVCVGDKRLLKKRAEQMGLPLTIVDYPQKSSTPRCLSVLHTPLSTLELDKGPDPANAAAVLKTLDIAIDGCLSGQFSAMVTGPLHKGIINDAGYVFSGHTEYLAERCGTDLPIMLLASSDMRVALATTHLALKDVSGAITQELIERVGQTLHKGMKKHYGIARPRILVCGLNPHAGEGGHLGMEEIDVIIPALEKLRSQGIDVLGPLPADTLFTEKYLQQADVVLAMYHDQGLPVLKAQSFGRAANITLGLPIIRTSVDHGTAIDLAGSGQADIGSLETAITVAMEMAEASRG